MSGNGSEGIQKKEKGADCMTLVIIDCFKAIGALIDKKVWDRLLG